MQHFNCNVICWKTIAVTWTFSAKLAFSRCDERGARTQCDVTQKTTPPITDVIHLYSASFRSFCYNFWQYCKKILHDHRLNRHFSVFVTNVPYSVLSPFLVSFFFILSFYEIRLRHETSFQWLPSFYDGNVTFKRNSIDSCLTVDFKCR
jgi:hypothetical protein